VINLSEGQDHCAMEYRQLLYILKVWVGFCFFGLSLTIKFQQNNFYKRWLYFFCRVRL